MLGTIEDLEKEIEQFQNNIMASGELVNLLRQMLDQVKQQNESFERQSSALIAKVDSLPATIENANSASNQKVKNDVSDELAQALRNISIEQQKYITSIQQADQMIKASEEKLDRAYKEFIGTLEKMNISNLYEQNKQLKNELSKRTTILMVVTIVGVVIGIVGFFI